MANKKNVKKNPVKERKVSKKEQIKNQNKILTNIILGVVIFLFLIFVLFLTAKAFSSFEYEGIKFKIVKEGDLVLYQTSLPVIYQGEPVPYNFYLRNDPRKLNEISFNGNLALKQNIAIKSTENFNCDGDGIIGIANLANLYGISGINMVNDENAVCDPEGDYTFIRLQKGDETEIRQVGASCYHLNINNCEILKATERLMIESLIEIHKII